MHETTTLVVSIERTVFVRITRSYRFSPKYLSMKPANMQFVFITQSTYRKDIKDKEHLRYRGLFCVHC